MCGVEFGSDDYEKSNDKSDVKSKVGRVQVQYSITKTGTQRVVDAIGIQMACASLDKLRMLVKLGLPEINVESGRILSKVNYRANSTTVKGREIENITVRTPSLTGPEGFKTRIGLTGEIEVKFSVARSKTNG
jgi:hypothetical protein